MLQNFANYLLGTIVTQNQQQSSTGVENTRLTSVEQEDDWVLVDRDSEGNSDAGSMDGLDEEDYQETDPNLLLPVLLTRTSSTSSLPCATNMEESWFITPPPCFTSAGPIHMETSPLENLLIEHPSMSVYHQHAHPGARRHVAFAVPVRTTSRASSAGGRLDDDDDEVEEDRPAAVVVAVQRRTAAAPRLNRVQVLQQQETQLLKTRRAQKVQVQKACKSIKRNNLDRQNKAREVNCRNRRQRRGERSQGATRSYANNNRKC